MTDASVTVLLLEDSDIDTELVAAQLRRLASEVTITRVSSRNDFIAAVEHGRFDIVLADYSPPDFDGLTALSILREKRPDAPFIFISGLLGEEFAIEALKRGATDYILKRSLVRLPSAIERALAEAHERAERHRAEAALLRSEARLQRLNDLLRREVKARTRERDRIWEISPDLLAVVRASDGVPILVNQAWTKLLGWSEADMLTTTIRDLVHPGDRGLADAAREDQPVMFENRIRNAGGLYRWFSWNVVPDEGLLYAVGHDVTEKHLAAEELAATNRALKCQIDEREKVEQTLRQMQRLEAVGQLTSGVAHDFNNLLTVILGNLTFLEREPSQSPIVKRRLAHMRAAAERGAQLTAQLLAFSRRQRLEPKPLNLNETVEGMSDLLRSTMGGTVRFETGPQPNLWPALVDPTQIELIILNLAINARDAMRVGGSLTIQTSNVTRGEPTRPEEPGPGDYVVLSVSDTGAGMTEEILARAFEPFFTTKPVGKGSGLGLAQVYGFAKQSGGGVSIATKLNEGTTVSVFLPRAVRAPQTGSDVKGPAADSHSSSHQCRILLVDNDSAVREVTAALLHDLGCLVFEAGSGGAALDTLDRVPNIDLLLVDYAMPGMNGAEIAAATAARRPGIPVLFITGYADLTALHEIGEERILQKPFGPEELAGKLRRILSGGNVIPFSAAARKAS
jgi:PAS domain S-box-containing protein